MSYRCNHTCSVVVKRCLIPHTKRHISLLLFSRSFWRLSQTFSSYYHVASPVKCTCEKPTSNRSPVLKPLRDTQTPLHFYFVNQFLDHANYITICLINQGQCFAHFIHLYSKLDFGPSLFSKFVQYALFSRNKKNFFSHFNVFHSNILHNMYDSYLHNNLCFF